MPTVHEPLAPGLSRVWELHDVVHDGVTAYQHVVIAETAQGVTLFCDDDRQSSEFSQLTYHEALMVPALLLADDPRAVLIIGSSEGVASQIAVQAGAARVDHVDIDREAVELCARHLPYGYTVEELRAAERGDGKVRVHYADGWTFLAEAAINGTRYDVVIVDLPDEREEEAQHNRLYQEEFLERCRDVLAPGGVVGYQGGCPTLWRNATLRQSWQRFHDVFRAVAYYGSDEHEWAFLFGRADEVELPLELMAGRLARLAYQPVTIDAAALWGCGTPPHAVRHMTAVPASRA